MLHITILCVGKIKENYLKEAINEYSKRLSKYCKLEIVELADEPIPENLNDTLASQIKTSESENIAKHIPQNSHTIALDLTGKTYTSEFFAQKIEDLQMSTSHITFIIGGSLGIFEELKNSVNEKISFSTMTFPHQLIRVFLLEQIFRAFKINNNEKYHK